MDKYMQTIRGIMATLDGVKVEGRENWLKMLSCQQALENMLTEMTKEAATKEQQEE